MADMAVGWRGGEGHRNERKRKETTYICILLCSQGFQAAVNGDARRRCAAKVHQHRMDPGC